MEDIRISYNEKRNREESFMVSKKEVGSVCLQNLVYGYS